MKKEGKRDTQKNITRKKGQTKEQRTEKQILIILFVCVAILAAVLIVYFVGKYHNKPYFDFHGFKVYAVMLEGTNMIFYNIPDVTFTVQTTEYLKNVVIRNDPRELEKMNLTVYVSNRFYKTLPQQLWMSWNPDEKATIYEAELEIKKFANNLNIPVGIVPADVTLTCENSTSEKRMIVLKTLNITETKIYENKDFPNCITIEADSYDNLIKAADRLVIDWLLKIS